MTGRRLHLWEGARIEDLGREWGAASVHAFARLGSTNDFARGLAAAGAPAGTVVLAEEQVAGRGRAGRAWSSPPGLGLWLSVVARPTGDPSLLPLRVGLAVAESLDPFLGRARAQIKWPNDLLAGGRKLGGILCEGSWEAAGARFVIVGVGLNVLHAVADFPDGIRERATSIALAAGAATERRAVAGSVVPAVLAALAGPQTLDAPFLARLDGRDALRGRVVEVTDPSTGEPLARGVADGIAADGSLRLAPDDGGPQRAIRAGTVRPISEPV